MFQKITEYSHFLVFCFLIRNYFQPLPCRILHPEDHSPARNTGLFQLWKNKKLPNGFKLIRFAVFSDYLAYCTKTQEISSGSSSTASANSSAGISSGFSGISCGASSKFSSGSSGSEYTYVNFGDFRSNLYRKESPRTVI